MTDKQLALVELRTRIYRLKCLLHAAWGADSEYVTIKRSELDILLNRLKLEIRRAKLGD